ncbi:MAG: hypothetical protein NTV43_02320 [Methylococcales bacterium]|nr:hypothetical protein [Methylococcales bacterium]
MNDFYKDFFISTLVVVGLVGYISGEFIMSSTVFAAASIASQFNRNRRMNGHLSCD